MLTMLYLAVLLLIVSECAALVPPGAVTNGLVQRGLLKRAGWARRGTAGCRGACISSLSMVQLLSPENSRKDVFLYNTEKRGKEVFKAIDEGGESSGGVRRVSFYSCGPTVYDYAHIGNFRAFLTYDILKRWLTYCGYDVEHVCNLTDVDDKIIVKMQAEGRTLKDITNQYAEAFFDDLSVLNIIKAKRYPRATEHIGDIISMIAKLMETGHAYEKNSSVYFRVEAFESYGKLANLNFDEVEENMQEGAGGAGPNEKKGTDEKESPRDFALWKAFVEGDGEVVWDSPFGRGRPGWHIECSAMCNCLLGKTIDIHAGGVDLVFPHHQNEVAQSEAFSGQTFCNYWIHNGFVNINNEKMSKSLKNFKTLRDIAQTPFDARAFRYMVVSNQYRSQLNFTPDTLKAAQQSLKRIDKVIAKLEEAVAAASPCTDEDAERKVVDTANSQVLNFEVAMMDDMNTPRGSAAFFGIITTTEKFMKKNSISAISAGLILDVIRRMDSVFGVLYEVPVAYFGEGASSVAVDENIPLPLESIPAEVITMADQRFEAKAAKDWSKADELRAAITALGFTIKDVKSDSAKYEIYKA